MNRVVWATSSRGAEWEDWKSESSGFGLCAEREDSCGPAGQNDGRCRPGRRRRLWGRWKETRFGFVTHHLFCSSHIGFGRPEFPFLPPGSCRVLSRGLSTQGGRHSSSLQCLLAIAPIRRLRRSPSCWSSRPPIRTTPLTAPQRPQGCHKP